MRPDFELTKPTVFAQSPGVPNGYLGPVLEGASVFHASHPSVGTVVLQELESPYFSLQYAIYQLVQPFAFIASRKVEQLSSFLALKNSIHYHFKHSGSFELQQGEFSLLHSNETLARIAFDQPGDYHTLEVSWGGQMLKDVLPLFSFLHSLQSAKDIRRSFHLMPYRKTAGFRSLGAVHTLLHTAYTGDRERHLFELKVHEYLVALLCASQQPPVRYSGISREDYKRLQAMADKLSGNPAKKFPLHALSMQLHMNEKKLNRIFGQIFGKPVFEYHLEARMKEAHRLLEETDLTTKQVAAKVGYARTTSFISRFKDFFGYPPGEITRSK